MFEITLNQTVRVGVNVKDYFYLHSNDILIRIEFTNRIPIYRKFINTNINKFTHLLIMYAQNTILCSEGKIVQNISYQETAEICQKLCVLFSKHIKERNCILLFMETNIYIPAIILSIKNSSHCFMPIASYSKNEEIEELILQQGIQYILTFNSEASTVSNFYSIDHILLGTDKILLWKSNVKHMKHKKLLDESSILCIIPSSGTTGKRKLIKIENYCIQKNVESLRKIFQLTKNDVIYFGTPLTFDPSLVELFLSLNTGADLLMVPENIKYNPEKLFHTLFPKNSEYLTSTFLQMVPSLFTRWTEKQIQYILNDSELKILALGGESFPIEILQFKRSVKLYNLYGITEISCWATVYEIGPDNNVLLGNILDETLIRIYSDGKEVQEGIGELFIGSDSRHCYINDETEKVSWRCTGDLVDKSEKGISYLGRTDNIIKRLGHQISLEEIERKVYGKIGIPCKCVWSKTHLKLLLFILLPKIYQENKMRIVDKIRVSVLPLLKKEEIPDFFDIISKFPITSNGKIDKTTLVEIYEHDQKQISDQSAYDIFLLLLARFLGQSIHNIESIKSYTFSELGGNSILYTLFINSFKDILNCDLSNEFLSLLFDKPIDECMSFLKQDELMCSVSYKKPMEKAHFFEEKRKYLNREYIVWKYNLQACVDASPLIFCRKDKHFVAVGSFSSHFGIFDALSGQTQFLELFEDSIGSAATISPCSNFLYFGCFNGKLFCISLENFCVLWSYEAGNSIKCTPYFFDLKKALIFGSYDKHLHYIDAETGKLIWKTNIEESIVTTPLLHYSSGQILVTTLMGSCISLSVSTGRLNWHIHLGSPIFGTPCLFNENYLIISDVRGNVISLDIRTKKNTFILKVESEIYSSVIFLENNLMFSSHQGYLYKCKLKDNIECDTIKKVYLNDRVSTTPCIFQYFEKMLIGIVTVKGNLYLVDYEDMKIETQHKCPGDVYSSLIFHSNNLYFGCRDNNLYCISIQSLLNSKS